MKKIYENIIIGSGFSAFIISNLIKKNYVLITTEDKLINNLPKRKKLTKFLKFFTTKFCSYGKYQFHLKNSTLHDTLIHGGNTNLWGGICNITEIKKFLIFLNKIFSLKKLGFNETGSSTNFKSLLQIQELNNKNGKIFNCSKYFKKKIVGHLLSFKSLDSGIIRLKIKKKKNETMYCKKLILAVNFTQLLEILINSNIIKNKDEITLNEFEFDTKISLFSNLNLIKKNALILSYSVSGIIKHALGLQRNFNFFLFKFLNMFPFYYHQIFYEKLNIATFKIIKEKKLIKEIVSKTNKKFGRSVHYFNMMINKKSVKERLQKINNNIYGISAPFLTKVRPGPISNNLIKNSFIVAKKINK